jgi:type I restriction enzyme, R subunit
LTASAIRKTRKIIIVTSKLLTGFDAPILQTMYLDKPLRDHTLLEAICRTSRPYGEQKTHGLIVDYLGISTT